jgi:hypothetical protein
MSGLPLTPITEPRGESSNMPHSFRSSRLVDARSPAVRPPTDDPRGSRMMVEREALRQGQPEKKFLGHTAEFVLQPGHVVPVHAWLREVSDWMQSKDPTAPPLMPQKASLLDDVIEPLLIQSLLRLIPNLDHCFDDIRQQIAIFLLQLASIFNPELPVQNIVLQLATLQESSHTRADILFQGIGKSLSVARAGFCCMLLPPRPRASWCVCGGSRTGACGLQLLVVALVAGLEGQYLYPDMRVRDLAVCAATRLIFENGSVFVDQDSLAAVTPHVRCCPCSRGARWLVQVWNLYFLLDLLSGSGRAPAVRAVTRLPVMHALRVLCPLFVAKPALCEQIVTRLMCCPDKSLPYARYRAALRR